MRYIDADKLLESVTKNDFNDWLDYDIFRFLVEEVPTADVVPKSEVEKLICKLECLLCHVTGGRLSKHTYDLGTMETVATDCINETYNDGYEEGYKECAREIFAEIENHLFVIAPIEEFNGWARMRLDDVERLKKKYQEGE